MLTSNPVVKLYSSIFLPDVKTVNNFVPSVLNAKPVVLPFSNVTSLVNLLLELSNLSSQKFVFSSSCTVYGRANAFPITEDEPIKLPESPYGNTKKVAEEILYDVSLTNKNFNVISLRWVALSIIPKNIIPWNKTKAYPPRIQPHSSLAYPYCLLVIFS